MKWPMALAWRHRPDARQMIWPSTAGRAKMRAVVRVAATSPHCIRDRSHARNLAVAITLSRRH